MNVLDLSLNEYENLLMNNNHAYMDDVIHDHSKLTYKQQTILCKFKLNLPPKFLSLNNSLNVKLSFNKNFDILNEILCTEIDINDDTTTIHSISLLHSYFKECIEHQSLLINAIECQKNDLVNTLFKYNYISIIPNMYIILKNKQVFQIMMTYLTIEDIKKLDLKLKHDNRCINAINIDMLHCNICNSKITDYEVSFKLWSFMRN